MDPLFKAVVISNLAHLSVFALDDFKCKKAPSEI